MTGREVLPLIHLYGIRVAGRRTAAVWSNIRLWSKMLIWLPLVQYMVQARARDTVMVTEVEGLTIDEDEADTAADFGRRH